jgi:PAS domain S-box-containing protein
MTPEEQQLDSEIQERLRFETLLADLSSKFINLPAGEVDREIGDAQRRVCECLGLDFSTLWQWSAEAPNALTLTHLYRPLGGPPPPERMDGREFFPWSHRQLLAGKVIAVSTIDDLPAEATRDRETYLYYGVKTALSIPLSAGGDPVVGAISFHTQQRERSWPDPLVKRLELIAQIFANALVRRRSEEALAESEERLKLAADAAAAGLWSLKLETGLYWITDKTRDLLGLTRGEILSFDRFMEFVHPEDRDLIRERVQVAIQSGEEGSVEYRIIRGDGSPRWMASQGRIHRNAAGEADLLMGVTFDITERKLAEEAVRTNEARLASAIDVAELGFYEVTGGLNVTYLDERLRAICGVPREADNGVQTAEFWVTHIHPDDRQRVLDLHLQLDGGDKDRAALEYRYLHPQSGLRWIHLLSHVLRRDGAGLATYTIGVMRDITHLKQAEEELDRLRLQLWHADRVAQTGTIAASLAHELNQPLAAILNNAQAGLRFLAGDNHDLEEFREILSDIVDDDRRAADVINGLRSMLRLKEARRERIDLADTIQGILILLKSELLNQQIQLDLHLEHDFPILADKVQIQQVVMNLVMNAVEAMGQLPAVQRRLVLSLARSLAGKALVSVRDSGPGISGDQRDKVFEAFWTTKHQGLGIGLPIARSIVESYGGTLWCENNQDQGATFYFTLPVADDPDTGAEGEGRPDYLRKSAATHARPRP